MVKADTIIIVVGLQKGERNWRYWPGTVAGEGKRERIDFLRFTVWLGSRIFRTLMPISTLCYSDVHLSGDGHMKTSVEVDEKLLGRVKHLLGTETIRDTIRKSFEVVVRQKALEESARLMGKIDVDLTQERIRAQRRARRVPH